MKSQFRTTDLSIAAYLQLSGLSLSGLEPSGEGRATFVFEDAPERESLVMQYLNQQSLVDPSRYLATMKRLKAMANEMRQYQMRGIPDAPSHQG